MKCPKCGYHSLSKRQKEVLYLLSQKPATKYDLHKSMNVPFPRISEIVSLFEKEGWVQRKPIKSEKNNIKFLFTLTQVGIIKQRESSADGELNCE